MAILRKMTEVGSQCFTNGTKRTIGNRRYSSNFHTVQNQLLILNKVGGRKIRYLLGGRKRGTQIGMAGRGAANG